ncbi:JAB domain-containing protein [Sphingobacterium olei]|uniref:JAB domain-containing protein n=1 Tax=Sphingobacterium olei TaxID=2571155 RepID=UPI001EE4842F|nr:JAB domain-containing protein [Sphingobacterium olei]
MDFVLCPFLSIHINYQFYYCALLSNAIGIAIAHNHPTGTLEPCRFDKILTKEISAICGFLNIRLLDHVILTSEFHVNKS